MNEQQKSKIVELAKRCENRLWCADRYKGYDDLVFSPPTPMFLTMAANISAEAFAIAKEATS